MQGEAALQGLVGQTFCTTCHGSLVAMTVKTTQTFVITVVQEPLALHVGTFRFHALYHDSTRTHGFSVIQRFVAAFDQQSAQAHDIGTSADAGKTSVEVKVRFPPGSLNAVRRHSAGDPLLSAAAAFQSSNDNLLKIARSSSLVMHEVAVIEGWNRRATVRRRSSIAQGLASAPEQQRSTDADPSSLDVAGMSLRESVYLSTNVSVVVGFSVFGTAHSVTLDLRPVPGSPAIVRELFVWNFMMDMYRTNHRLAGQLRAINAVRGIVEDQEEARIDLPNSVDEIQIRVPDESAFVFPVTPTTGSLQPATVPRPPSATNVPPRRSRVATTPSDFDPKPARSGPQHYPRRWPLAAGVGEVASTTQPPLEVLAQPKLLASAGKRAATSAVNSEVERFGEPADAKPPHEPGEATEQYNGVDAVSKAHRPLSAQTQSPQTGSKRPFSGNLRNKEVALSNVLQTHELRHGAKVDGHGVRSTANSNWGASPHECGGVARSPRPGSARPGALGHVVVVSLRDDLGARRTKQMSDDLVEEQNLVSPWSKSAQ